METELQLTSFLIRRRRRRDAQRGRRLKVSVEDNKRSTVEVDSASAFSSSESVYFTWKMNRTHGQRWNGVKIGLNLRFCRLIKFVTMKKKKKLYIETYLINSDGMRVLLMKRRTCQTCIQNIPDTFRNKVRCRVLKSSHSAGLGLKKHKPDNMFSLFMLQEDRRLKWFKCFFFLFCFFFFSSRGWSDTLQWTDVSVNQQPLPSVRDWVLRPGLHHRPAAQTTITALSVPPDSWKR